MFQLGGGGGGGDIFNSFKINNNCITRIILPYLYNHMLAHGTVTN